MEMLAQGPAGVCTQGPVAAPSLAPLMAGAPADGSIRDGSPNWGGLR